MSVLGPHMRSFEAASAVTGYRLVAAAGVGATVRNAAAATDKIVGAAERMGCSTVGAMADVIVGGWTDLQAGGAIAFMDPITSDALGRAVKAVPIAGQTVSIAGFAEADAVLGDIFPALIAPSLLRTPA